jgi:subtilisin family serine protease
LGDGCKVVTGWDIYDDDDDTFSDCHTHGTHVAGVIGASGDNNPLGMTGVAPDASLAFYKMFASCRGAPMDNMVVAAYLKAYEDGSDIITSSIGGSNGWSSDPESVVVKRIVEKGVPCTLAHGNGDEGLFLVASPTDSKGAVAVSSFDSPHWPVSMFEASYTIDGEEPVSFG